MLSGNISPQSRMMILPSTSMHAQLRPISPSPPRKTIRTGSAKMHSQIRQKLLRLVFQPGRRRPHRQPAVTARQAQRAEHHLGGNGVRRLVAGLVVEGAEHAGIDLAGALDVALAKG